ncbi:MAG: AFG1 family ATPase [Betaproteobacteria bacterium]|nr:AFG1 family ATPase [Betaproteobacteria bacterium]
MRDSVYESEDLPPLPPIGGGSVFDSTEYTEPAKRLAATVAELYRETLERRGFVADDAQYAAVLRLQRVYEEWMAYKERRSSALRRLVVRPPLPRGVYLWGGVGRGKSFLLDSFYLTLPVTRKRRVHFHHFMRDVHREMDTLKGISDPLDAVAARIATRYRLICFDEFHVNDIADAMILGRLLKKTMDRGVVFYMTSNYHPDELYRHGLKRENFLPTIALIRDRLDEVNVDSGIDYRLRTLEQVQVYHTPPGPEAEAALLATFRRIADVEEEHHELDVEGRVIPYRHRAGGVVWFEFSVLCGHGRSQLDYLDLAKRFHSVIVSGVPRFDDANRDALRRFTLLVDVFYESRIKLILSAAVPVEQLLALDPDGVDSRFKAMLFEFSRTSSRLAEMQAREYMLAARIRPG